MDLESLKIFVKVAELQSFTRAAEHLGISKARASLRVASLEEHLGAPLLQRTTRAVVPTPDGADLLERARRLIAEADEIDALFQAPEALRGRVRIDMPATFARDVIIPKLPEFVAKHPQVEWLISTTDRHVEVVREGFDCVVRIGELGDSGLVAKRLGTLSMMNLVSPGYARKHGVPRTIADLDRHLLVNYSLTLSGEPPVFEYVEAGRRVDVRMKSLLTVNSADAYLAACIAGFGIIQVPRVDKGSKLERGLLVEVLPELTAAPMPVSLVHGQGRNVPKRVRAVMAFLADVLAPFVDAR